MCEDLDTQAERYMRSVMSGNKGDVFTRSDLYEYIIEAYKQGYRDAQSPSTIYRRIPNIRGRVERMQIQHRLNNLNNK